MRRITALAIVTGVSLFGGLTVYLTKGEQKQASLPPQQHELEIMTGAIGATPAPPPTLPFPSTVELPVPAEIPEAYSRAANGSVASSKPSCGNVAALGVSRVVEIDTSGGPGFGFEHFKQHDFLRDKEVVLTFDDGPWPTTAAVMKALADECVLATFFAIGKHATYYPEILRSLSDAGHSVGSHTWSHQDLSKKSAAEATIEIEKGMSAVKWALGDKAQQASFFRFPALRHPSEMVTYLGQRNVAVFSTDLDSFDFRLRKPDRIVQSVMTKLHKHGKGIVLMHDFQTGTSQAVAQLLSELKAGGYRIVHLKSRSVLETLAQYDEELQKGQRLPTMSQRATSSVVRDIQ